MAKRKRGPTISTKHPEPEAVTLPLTFQGLDLRDGCGARLEPGDRLSGLCPACLEPKTKRHRERDATASDSVRGRR
jgi:hypothetical protein